ncbi:hypothetical protein F4777DRAFT_424533 [Nemania sp. FL0916]|nr:hypothetical protein F4777DRAFT_424533 [Nemania sp. FL0916]
MDTVLMARSPASSPLKGKPGPPKKMTGRGISKKTARKNAAAAALKKVGRPKGRGRNKVYEDPRVQAAYERQKVLRDLYSEVAGAIKPVLEDLADRNIQKLIESPTAHKEPTEYEVLQRQLDDRLAETIRAADRELKTKTAISEQQFQLYTAGTRKTFLDGYDHAADEFYSASLKRAGLLAELQHEGLDASHPDTTYTYVEKPNEVVDEQGTWVAFRNGVKVPYPHLSEESKKAAVAKVQVGKGRPPTKRKADEQPDGQPDSKRISGPSGSARLDNGDEVSTPQPRHIKGLLSAETEPDGEPESNVASPSPETDPRMEVSRGRRDLPDLPNGASEPDKWGVRTVNRRGPRANNRLILPLPYTYDDDEIGFRDSTNDSSKKATRGTRGNFLDNPNSRNLHIDRTIVTYDCLDNEDGALDSDLVQKHGLHPKYGLFLPDSRNESETPPPHVSGSNPVVVITANGATLHASRSVRGYNMDNTLREDAKKETISRLLTQHCENEGLDSDEISTEEIRERERHRRIAVQLAVEKAEAEKAEVQKAEAEKRLAGRQLEGEDLDDKDREIDESVGKENAAQLLNAALFIEADRSSHPTVNARSSRPYDAVRDVFTNTEPAPAPAPAMQPHVVPNDFDTHRLSCLADEAERVTLQRDVQIEPHLDPRLEPHLDPHLDPRIEPHLEHSLHHHPDYPMEHHMVQVQYEYHNEYALDIHSSHLEEHQWEQHNFASAGDSMIDPRLRGPPNHVPPPQNTFLQTALNPSTLAHIAPNPYPYRSIEPTPQAVSRIPFTNQGGGKGSPVLPPLRPARGKGLEPVHPQASPGQPGPDFGQPPGMVQSNSGSFFPPAASRSYHQGYTMPDQNSMMGMSYMMPGGGMVSAQHEPHLGQANRYQPPSPTLTAHAQLVPGPMYMSHGASVSPPGSSMGLQSPTGPPGSRHRSSISSGSNSAVNGKYRKIAAAPIPHNRPWQSNSGAELRLAHYDHKEAIKDYRANEPPPRTGPTTIRGWNVNNGSKGRKGLKKEDSEEKDSPSITTFINKWNPSEKAMG